MQFHKWFLENELTNIILYHGTASDFESFDISFSGERDYGDSGLGVYLTPKIILAKMYAWDASRRQNKPAIILSVKHNFQKTANLDSPELQKQIQKATGAPFPKKIQIINGKQTRPKKESEDIKKYLISLGYDSATAQYGNEIIAYDPSKLQIVDKIPLKN
jgi:hypothetical protein